MAHTAVCPGCGGDVVHVGTYSAGSGALAAESDIEVGFCLACGEALRLVEESWRGVIVAQPVLVPPPT